MKKILLLLTAFVFLFSDLAELSAQDKDITLGIGGGLNYGINEARREDRTWGPLFGVTALYRNGLGQGLTPEFTLDYNINQTSGTEGYSEYETSHINAALGLRYYPFNLNQWAPYASGGFGVTIFDVQEIPFNADPESENSGAALMFPVRLGITHFFNETFGMDFNLGVNFTTTDDLNPVYDDIKDGMWAGKLSFLVTVHKFERDSDGDGLPDKEEERLGTDPNNPDTDDDGLLDGEEVNKYRTDPLDKDTDDGGIMDGLEVLNGADPLDPDDDILSIAPGEKLILRNIEFATAKTTITNKSERILGFALKAMQKAVDMEFEIVGHTDDVGELESNMKLSADRAEAVKKWFVDKGIDAGRLTTKGMGPNEPLVPNSSPANRQKNRRVEFYRVK